MQPLYTTLESVKLRLTNKVQFQHDPKFVDDGELPDTLLHQLIADSEAEVEQDLRTRYMVPFQHKITNSWYDLPPSTKRMIRVVVDLKAVINVLETDFGRGTHINADGYIASQRTHYDDLIQKLTGRDKDGKYLFSPALEDLKMATTNKADDAYRGMIINTDQDRRDSISYATEQLDSHRIFRFPLKGFFK